MASPMPGTWDSSGSAPASAAAPATPKDQPASSDPFKLVDTHAYVMSRMLSRRHEFLAPKTIGIKVGSWNIGDFRCWNDISSWLPEEPEGEKEEHAGVDIVVLGLQEVVNVTQSSSFLKYMDPKIALTWKAHVQAALPTGFECVAAPQLIGMLLLVYVSPRLAGCVGSVSVATVGTGFMGYVGNKGAVGVRIVLGDTLRVSFVDCHLAAFANAVDRRNWDAAEVLRRMVFEPVGGEVVGLAEGGGPVVESLDGSDVVIWCGDLNYRLDLENLDIRGPLQPYMPQDLPPTHADITSPISSPIMNKDREWDIVPRLPPTPTEVHPNAAASLQGTIDSLLKHDQLLKQRREGKVLSGYKEGRITFLPTYKYDVGSVGLWDSSEKVRAPSWCDRILWRVKEPTRKDGAGMDVARERRGRGYSVASDILNTALKDEVLFETVMDDESDEEDLVVSRGESPTPYHEPIKAAPPVFDDATSKVGTAFGEIKLVQKEYTSYQYITSSDHKPISATFSLTFPAVVPEARATVHAEVVREVDKLENERRPVVTVIIDQPTRNGTPVLSTPTTSTEPPKPFTSAPTAGDEIIHFGEVRFWERKTCGITVANTGTSLAKMSFVKRPSPDDPDTEVVSKPWVTVSFPYEKKELQPGEVATISISLLIDAVQHVLDLNDGRESLDDVLVLRVDGGRDVFLPISATWLPSSYGTTLMQLVSIPENIGGFRGFVRARDTLKDGPLYSVPREIYRITQFLCDATADAVSTLTPDERMEEKRWFAQPGWPLLKETWGWAGDEERRRRVEVGVWEALDTDGEFADESCVRVVMADDEEEVGTEEQVEAVAAVLLRWLEGLSDGVIPTAFWEEVVKAGGDGKAAERVLDHLLEKAGRVHANVFVSLAGFVAEMLSILVKKKEGDRKKEMEAILGKVLEPLAAAVVRRPGDRVVGAKTARAEEEARRAWLRKFIEM